MTMKPLTIACIGCGGRGLLYLELAARQPERYRVVAAADPDSSRLKRAAQYGASPGFRCFRSDVEILAEPKLADLMIIGTQDSHHREHAIGAMRRGYDLLLEKPIAPNPEDVKVIREVARELGRRVLVCHVLRYTPFYRKVKSLVDSGVIGELISLNATEGVEAWHQAHSFVRGHWSVAARSSPMILAKSCHDMDILRWIIGSSCKSLSSYGGLRYFTEANRPEGAPARCLSGCPVGDQCIYNAERYLTDKKPWLKHVSLPQDGDPEVLRKALHASPWGRCVYQSDNDVVDHQTVNLLFEGGITATFTMTAFEEGRHIEIFGSKARLLGGERVREAHGCDILIKYHGVDRAAERHEAATAGHGYGAHMGGDAQLMEALYEEMRSEDADSMTSSLEASVESHIMAFAAEESRLSGQTIVLQHL